MKSDEFQNTVHSRQGFPFQPPQPPLNNMGAVKMRDLKRGRL